MTKPWDLQRTFGCAAMILAMTLSMFHPAVAQQSVVELQAHFDRENNSVKKAKLLVKLGEAQFDQARRAGKEGDNNGVDAMLEKYRDNVRAAFEALKKQHTDAEKHSNGYRQMEIHVREGSREVEDSMLAAPAPYKPQLQIVRQDLITIDEELIRLLFPHRPADRPVPPAEKQP